MGKGLELASVSGQGAFLQHLAPHGLIDLLAAFVVGGDDDGVLGCGGVVLRNSRNAVLSI